MALESGTQLGHYEITREIGKGGMGEVYRARDTKLGREVAIKVLPSEFSQDAERLARLEREARMLAALNHPNIAAIHGLEEHEGSRFLVLELVEGETLADHLKRGAIPVGDSLKLARQIAEALEAAHAKGVIHRDLKPANIKITPEGRVKVLDFGLAKAFIDDSVDVSLSNSPTLSVAATQRGIVLGTAGYMSPEQAGGEPADQRADIWAFGVVLFEMLTGRGLFTGKTVAHVLASVMKEAPDWSQLPPSLHPRVRFLLERCLEKEPDDRCHRVGEIRAELQRALEEPLDTRAVPPSAEISARSRPWLPWAATVAIALVAGLAIGWLVRPAPIRSGPVVRFQHEVTEAAFRNTGRDVVAISPDGTQIVFNTVAGLLLRSVDDTGDRLIPGTEALLTNPFFSADGEWIGFWDVDSGQLRKVPVSGGSSITLADASNLQGASWADDNTILFGQPEGIMRVSGDGGEPELIIPESGEEEQLWDPQLLPDGSVLFTVFPGGVISIQAPGEDQRTELFPGERAIYTSTGHLVVTDPTASPGALLARTFDLASRTAGGPVPMVEGVSVQNGKTHYAISGSGSLAYIAGTVAGGVIDSSLTWVTLTGDREPLPLPERPYRHVRISPDGERIAVQTTTADGVSDIWIWDLDGTTQMRQLTGNGNNSRPVWTADSQRLIFTSDREGADRIYWQSADLTGVAEPLTEGEDGILQWPDSVTPDGKTLSFTKFGGVPIQSVWTVSLDGGEPQLFVAGGQDGTDSGGSAFSPNGKWIAYRTNPQLELFVKPFPDDGTEIQMTQAGGSYPTFSADGTRMFYRRGFPAGVAGLQGGGLAEEFMAVDILSFDGIPQWTNERVLPIDGFVIFNGSRDYDIAPDGERFLMSFPVEDIGATEAPPLEIGVVVNWLKELEERVPVD